MSHTPLLTAVGLAITLLLSSGCATVNFQHPAVVEDVSPDVARVYFIRPMPVIGHDFADAPVTIEYQGEKLLKLSEDAYILIYIKPSKGIIKVYNNSRFTNRTESQQMWKQTQYRFIAGRTYFIYIHQDDEEFRGIFYTPELVHLSEAKRLAEPLHRIGGAAADFPIANITEALEAPLGTAKKQAPTLPEELYRHEDYMLKDKK